MAKLTLNDITSGYLAIPTVNANSALIEAALENTLSRDGTSPNAMEANLDMNSNRIINLGAPGSSSDAVRLIDLQDASVATSFPSVSGNTGKVLTNDGVAASWSANFKMDISALSALRTKTWQNISGTIYETGGTDVAIADGGTGASTKTAGFDALSPNTTKGDIAAHNGTNNVRFPIGIDGQFLLANSGASTGLAWTTVTNNVSSIRQTQFSGPLDANGYNNTISAGAGLNFNVDATPTNVVFTFANGFNTLGNNDSICALTADASNQGSLVASNTNYISADFVSSSSVTWGSYLVPPHYAYAFDRTRGALLNFEAADASVSMIDDFGNTWTASGNAQIDTAQFKFGTASLLLDGTGDFIRSSSITSLGYGSWEISMWMRLNSTPGAGSQYHILECIAGAVGSPTLILINVAGTIKLNFFASSNGSTQNIANAVAGTNTTWTLNQWNRIRIVFDALAGTYKVYLSLNGAAETADISVASTAISCPFTNITVGASASGTNGFDGWIDAFRIVQCATKTTTETPSVSAPTIADYPYHFFSIPEMKMYEVTAASASAGTNPTMTQRNRLFVAEGDTNGAAVTAVRNYAIRGSFVGLWVTPTPAVATTISKSHNIGTDLIRSKMELQCLLEGAVGYGAGDIITEISCNDAVPLSTAIAVRRKRNTVSFTTGSANAFLIQNGASGVANSISSSSSFQYRLIAERAF